MGDPLVPPLRGFLCVLTVFSPRPGRGGLRYFVPTALQGTRNYCVAGRIRMGLAWISCNSAKRVLTDSINADAIWRCGGCWGTVHTEPFTVEGMPPTLNRAFRQVAEKAHLFVILSRPTAGEESLLHQNKEERGILRAKSALRMTAMLLFPQPAGAGQAGFVPGAGQKGELNSSRASVKKNRNPGVCPRFRFWKLKRLCLEACLEGQRLRRSLYDRQSRWILVRRLTSNQIEFAVRWLTCSQSPLDSAFPKRDPLRWTWCH